MSDQSSKPSADDLRLIADALAEGWDQVVEDDPAEIDEERIAAYVEGRLSPRETRDLERLIANSPKALDTVDALGGALPKMDEVFDESTVATSAVSSTSASPEPVTNRPAWLAPWALAAGLLVAMAGGAALQWVSGASDRIAAQNQLAQLTGELLDLEKARLAVASSRSQVIQLAGRLSPDLLRATLTVGASTRGAEPPTIAEKQAIESASDQLLETVQRSAGSRADTTIESAAALLNTGLLSEAAEKIEKLGSLADVGEVSEPELWNLQACLMVAQSQELPLEQAEPKLEKATDLFRQAADGGVIAAWVNLASLQLSLGEDAAAQASINAYLKSEHDPERIEAVREAWQALAQPNN